MSITGQIEVSTKEVASCKHSVSWNSCGVPGWIRTARHGWLVSRLRTACEKTCNAERHYADGELRQLDKVRFPQKNEVENAYIRWPMMIVFQNDRLLTVDLRDTLVEKRVLSRSYTALGIAGWTLLGVTVVMGITVAAVFAAEGGLRYY